MTQHIPVAAPTFVGREREYVLECLDSTWISSNGPFVRRFEDAMSARFSVDHAISCANGTAALHLALAALGIGPGDEVICPTLTYVATANSIRYCGAMPVFVDSDAWTWNMDPTRVAEAVTPRTRAIIAVHLYGHPVDMAPLLRLAESREIAIVEDAAEAHGARYRGVAIGSLGHVSTLSFYGNKILTTGEGGMVLTRDDDLAASIRVLRGQGQDPDRRYWFPVIGFNYRMTNVAAAIGLAQAECFDWHVARRREIAAMYRERLAGLPDLQFSPEAPWAESAYWMSSVVLKGATRSERDGLINQLAAEGIETRPFFHPMHLLPPYRDSSGSFPVAERLSATGINLPSGAALTEEQLDRVVEALVRCLASVRRSRASGVARGS
jgi:perosamine synthetase